MSQSTASRSGRLVRNAVFVAIVAAAGLFLALSYFWFVSPSTESIESVGTADAVVVFAGGGGRLEMAEELMDMGVAPNLVIPNGRSDDVRTRLCDGAPFQVFCPETETIDTRGEAQTIARLAEENGWSRLVAVTSPYHVHRATYQLRQCHDGPVVAVAATGRLDEDAWVEKIGHEWLGTLAAMTIQRAC